MRVVLSGGGTGGHIYPAIMIANACLQASPHSKVLYIGTDKGMEASIVPRENIPFESIEITGFRRKVTWENVKTIIRFLKGVKKSKQYLRQFKPDVVIGTGGYVCGPVLYAAAKLGIPTLIHEQNVIPGLTNQFLSRYVSSVCVSFKGSEKHFPKAKHVKYTGNPRATAVVQANPEQGRTTLDIPAKHQIVMIVGGSRGAKAINTAMIDMAPFVISLSDTHFIYVTGESYYPHTMEAIRKKLQSIPNNLHIFPYIHQMPDILAATSLLVSRSGASTLAEMTALGIPSILIPSPNVTNNHQEANARWLEDEGASELILERELTASLLFEKIKRIVTDPIKREHMSIQARKLGQADSAQLVLNEVHRIVTT